MRYSLCSCRPHSYNPSDLGEVVNNGCPRTWPSAPPWTKIVAGARAGPQHGFLQLDSHNGKVFHPTGLHSGLVLQSGPSPMNTVHWAFSVGWHCCSHSHDFCFCCFNSYSTLSQRSTLWYKIFRLVIGFWSILSYDW